jgi:hypothetical protein
LAGQGGDVDFLSPSQKLQLANMAAISPLADFTFDYQHLLLNTAEKK